MQILIIGSGGREHTLCWKLAQSSYNNQLYITPGNAGTAQFGTNLPIAANDVNGIVAACITHHITMVVVGPEEPLVLGIVDLLAANELTTHIQVIGPPKFAAQLEGSKSFAKAFMHKHNIPTAAYKEFSKTTFDEGMDYIKNHTLPIVLKADGLAGGKGVIICGTHIEAMAEFEMMIMYSKFGDAGNKVVIEQFLDGQEFSVFAITDGKHYKILPIAKDYKKIGIGDTGLNTGGMGAVSPVPFVTDALYSKALQQIIIPTIKAFEAENMEYKGFVFFGLIDVNGEPMVIEYNCRLGDPETEVVLPRLNNDLLEIFIKLGEGNLDTVTIETASEYAATIVVASGGYPSYYNVGYTIKGLTIANDEATTVFVSGAVQEGDNVVTTSGRVLAITSLASTITDAVTKSKAALHNVSFEEMYYRTDIGYEFE